MKDGVFQTTADTVQSVEDLEKILFLWQEVTGRQSGQELVVLEGELESRDGFTFSALRITKEEAFDDEIHG